MRLHLSLLLLSLLLGQNAVYAAPNVVTTIRPVHSLVSVIGEGVFEPALLMNSSQSPHHYSLKPSERRLLEHADLVFWIGPGMESFMPRLVESLAQDTRVVSLVKSRDLVLLPVRVSGDHDHEHAAYDPHIWLNTHNVERMAVEITRHLVKADPENKSTYAANLARLKQQTGVLRHKLHQLLENNQQPFFTYHDAYQYFEQEFGLNNAGFVSTGADMPPGAGHISQLKQRMKQKNIQCVFYEAPARPPLLKSLLSGSNAEAIALDATGMSFPAGRNNLFQTMQSLADKLSDCLRDDE